MCLTKIRAFFLRLIMATGILILFFVIYLNEIGKKLPRELAIEPWNIRSTIAVVGASHGSLNTIKTMVATGLDLHSNSGRLILFIGLIKVYPEIVQYALSKGVDTDFTITGLTPLMMAVMSGKLELIQLMLEKNPNLQARDSNGETALDKAKKLEYKVTSLVALLESELARRYPASSPVSISEPRNGCPQGLVMREAFLGDSICVSPLIRDEVRADNSLAESRIQPNGMCKSGYVWREARTSDHVCVTPTMRNIIFQQNTAATKPRQPL